MERLTHFSDAVAAIAITLLAIDLPVPAGDRVPALWTSVRHDDGHYVAFLISFVTIAAAWSHYHDAFRYVERIDRRLRQFNMAWLLMIILVPFGTRLLTNRGHETLGAHALRFGFYALLQVLASVALLAMLRHLISHGQAPEMRQSAVRDLTWQCYELILGFGLSIPVFFATTYAWVLWFIIPPLLGHIRRLRRRNRIREGA